MEGLSRWLSNERMKEKGNGLEINLYIFKATQQALLLCALLSPLTFCITRQGPFMKWAVERQVENIQNEEESKEKEYLQLTLYESQVLTLFVWRLIEDLVWTFACNSATKVWKDNQWFQANAAADCANDWSNHLILHHKIYRRRHTKRLFER